MAWGAINAQLLPAAQRATSFKFDYSGGRGAYKTVKNACGRYRGPPLPFVVAACTARDGSHWVVQKWMRLRPDWGVKPPATGKQWNALELHLSHFSGELPKLEVYQDFIKINSGPAVPHIFGRYTYKGHGIYGLTSEASGNPLDRFGRNLYLEGTGTPYGPGWQRIIGFLAHRSTGGFCYSFLPGKSPLVRPAGTTQAPGIGSEYRLCTEGPGVTPAVCWQAKALSSWTQAQQDAMTATFTRVMAGDGLCKTTGGNVEHIAQAASRSDDAALARLSPQMAACWNGVLVIALTFAVTLALLLVCAIVFLYRARYEANKSITTTQRVVLIVLATIVLLATGSVGLGLGLSQ